MTEGIFLRLSGRLALGADDLQWILYKSRRKEPPAELDIREWRPIAFVSSTKDILLRCIRESGLDEDTAGSALEGYPSTFGAWKATQSAPSQALFGVPDRPVGSLTAETPIAGIVGPEPAFRPNLEKDLVG